MLCARSRKTAGEGSADECVQCAGSSVCVKAVWLEGQLREACRLPCTRPAAFFCSGRESCIAVC